MPVSRHKRKKVLDMRKRATFMTTKNATGRPAAVFLPNIKGTRFAKGKRIAR